MQRFSFPISPFSMAIAISGGLLLVPEMAAAQSSDGVTGGIMLSYSIRVRPAFGIGLDLRYSHYSATSLDPSFSDEWTQVYNNGVTGAFVQAAYLWGGAFRFALGVHGGYLPASRIVNWGGEIGWTFRTQSDEKHIPGGVGLHLGFVPAFSLIFAEAGPSLRGSIGLTKNMGNELILGLEARGPGPCFFTTCWWPSGRPLRTNDSAAPQLAPVFLEMPKQEPPSRTSRTEIDETTRQTLAAFWLRETSAECASIPAFLALARDLALVGASSNLVSRARRSAKEEATHTRLCAALASEYTGFDVTALMPGIPKQLAANREVLLKKLALESFWDGCVGEGAAAAQARRMVTHTADERTRETLSIVARDEQAHADLAADIVRFCLADGGKPIRETLAASIEMRRLSYENESFVEHNTHECTDEDKLLSLGCVDMSTQCLAREEALATSVQLVSS